MKRLCSVLVAIGLGSLSLGCQGWSGFLGQGDPPQSAEPLGLRDPGNAQAPPGLAPPQAGWLRQLRLTPQQLQDMQALRRQHQQTIQEQQHSLRQTRQQLRQSLAMDVSTSELQNQFRVMQQQQQRLQETRFQIMLEIRDILNPQQRRLLAKFLEERGEGWLDFLPRSPQDP
ncbi:MAG: periplasmic heavy metal sensor [Cyanobacteriota bacterium]|nr:periplasmic heavy metal sensor [Cyanobacteriota bacterium]